MPLLLTEGMPEWIFQREVTRYAAERGWLVHYTPPSHRRGMLRTQQGGDNGFPDIVLARDGRVLFVELKAARGAVSAQQKAWAAAIGTVYLWRPADGAEIVMVLE